MAEVIVKGRKYRILVDSMERLWNRLSFWTAAEDVEFESGDTLEDNIGSIKGITTSMSVSENGYAADATSVKTLNNNMGGLRFGQKDGEYGYYTGAGADTFRPFKDPRYQSSVLITEVPFNVANVTSKYRELTVDNFYPILNYASGWIGVCGCWSDWSSGNLSPTKNYDPNTGIFSGDMSVGKASGCNCGSFGAGASLLGYILMWE